MKKWRRLLHRWDPVTEDGTEGEEGGLDQAAMQAQLRYARFRSGMFMSVCICFGMSMHVVAHARLNPHVHAYVGK